MKEIDEILMKAIGMDIQQLYAKYGHKTEWKDFLWDIQKLVDDAKANPPLTIDGYKKIINSYEVELNILNSIRFEIVSVEEDVSDYEFSIEGEGKKVSGLLSRKKGEGGCYELKLIASASISNTYQLKKSDVNINTITQKIADFIYNHLIELPF